MGLMVFNYLSFYFTLINFAYTSFILLDLYLFYDLTLLFLLIIILLFTIYLLVTLSVPIVYIIFLLLALRNRLKTTHTQTRKGHKTNSHISTKNDMYRHIL